MKIYTTCLILSLFVLAIEIVSRNGFYLEKKEIDLLV